MDCVYWTLRRCWPKKKTLSTTCQFIIDIYKFKYHFHFSCKSMYIVAGNPYYTLLLTPIDVCVQCVQICL